jgi:MFS family permease
LRHLHYGWVVVFSGAFILGTSELLFYAFGVFINPMTTEFGWDRGALSGAVATCMLLAGILGIFSGRLSDKYGPRALLTLTGLIIGIGFLLMSRVNALWQVYLIWGLFMGIGGGCCIVPVLSTVPRWFVKRTGMAMGITVAGLGMGGIVLPLLAQWLMSLYGWQKTFLLLGLMAFIIIIPLAQLLRHSPQRKGLKPYGEGETVEDKKSLAPQAEGFSFKEAIKTGRFWVFGLIYFCFFFHLQVVTVHIVPYATDVGISAMVAASVLSIIAGVSIIGRLSMGFISDRIGSKLAMSVCLTIIALILIWLMFAREVWMFYLFAAVFGFAYGGMVPLQTIVPAELFGLRFLGIIMGSTFLMGTVGGALGAPLAGTIFDVTRSYSLAFLICVMLGVVAIILSLVLLRYKVREGGEVSS